MVPPADQRAFLHWKHRHNPAGRSPAWVAVCDGEIVGYRTFLRWTFERDGVDVAAVRAVDTATHPAHRGKGVFADLTMHAIEEVRREGVAFVFNTPNDKSRPGYLKMGWVDVGRLPISARVRSPAAAARLAGARVAAELWSSPTDAGVPAPALLADERLDDLLAALPAPPAGALRTKRTSAHLRWRYAFEPLAYRAVCCDGEDVRGGVIVFRVRRRGTALEAALCEVLVPRRSDARRAIGRLVRSTGADYAVALGRDRSAREGLLPLPNQGPRLTWRSVNDTVAPPSGDWRLGLGDIELF